MSGLPRTCTWCGQKYQPKKKTEWESDPLCCCPTRDRSYHFTQIWLSTTSPCSSHSSSSFVWQQPWQTWTVSASIFGFKSVAYSWPSKALDSWSAPPQWYHCSGWSYSLVLLWAPSWNVPSSNCCSHFCQKLLWQEGALVAPWWRVRRKQEKTAEHEAILSYALVYEVPTANG